MKQYAITLNDSDQRLDKFLKKLFHSATLSYLYKLNRKGNIKILQAGKKTKQSNEYKLQDGDIVQVFLSDSDIQGLTKKSSVESPSQKMNYEKLSKEDIVFQDDNLLVLNKSPGLNVHPGDHATKEVSLIEQVHDYLGNGLNSLTFKPSLIHRIDRDTSGIIMVAKNKHALTKLSNDFKSHTKIQKTYFAVVLGKLSRSSGTIRKKLKRLENAQKENKVQVSDTGLEAVTHYTLIDEYSIKTSQEEHTISTLELTIETGRMHQIRVHLAHIGNPIIGDKAYGNKKMNAYFAHNFGVSRQMLHAHKIGFYHPATKKRANLEAKLKKDMRDFLSKLKK